MQRTIHTLTTSRGRPAAIVLAVLLLAVSLAAVASQAMSTRRAGAEVPEILPPSSTYRSQGKQFGGGVIKEGPLPISDSCPMTLTGVKSWATWEVESSIGVGSKVLPGTEWTVKLSIDATSADNGRDGVHPLKIIMEPFGPVEPGAAVEATYDPVYNKGKMAKEPGYAEAIGPWGDWGYEYSSYSGPTILQPGDGAKLTMTITLRATQPGLVGLWGIVMKGHDWGDPKTNNPKYEFTCGTNIGWSWTVVPAEPPVAGPDAAVTDARYSAVEPGDANGGAHGIVIDVLHNDDDPNTPAGPGTKSEVRIGDWSAASKLGGTVSCGTDAQKGLPPGTPLAQLSAQDCTYSPPLNKVGADSFTYRLHHGTTNQTTLATVTVQLRPNLRPVASPAAFAAAVGQDATFDLAPFITSPDGDQEQLCMGTLPVPPDPAVGTVTLYSNCTFDWDNTNQSFKGSVPFSYVVCDTHLTLKVPNLGPNVVRAAGYEVGTPNDLNNNFSRRCRTSTVTIGVLTGLILPPTGIPDLDVVDAGYAEDAIGAYTLSIPVLANDTDGNGPPPSMPTAELAVLDPPDVAQGTATVVGDRIEFTPTDGYAGSVELTYRVCEDPSVQDPPYADDPNTPFINEGLPFCGVGTVAIEVLANEAPLAGPDDLLMGTHEILSGFDVSGNDADPEGTALTCTPGPLVFSDPALVEAASIDATCLIHVDPVDGQSGVVEAPYEICDSHKLATPSYPAVPYGEDGRTPGMPASRCSTGVISVTIVPAFLSLPQDPPDPDGGDLPDDGQGGDQPDDGHGGDGGDQPDDDGDKPDDGDGGSKPGDGGTDGGDGGDAGHELDGGDLGRGSDPDDATGVLSGGLTAVDGLDGHQGPLPQTGAGSSLELVVAAVLLLLLGLLLLIGQRNGARRAR